MTHTHVTRDIKPPGRGCPDCDACHHMTLRCPRCPAQFEVSEEDPDATLSDLRDHLHAHTRDPDEHTRLFIRAQENAAGEL